MLQLIIIFFSLSLINVKGENYYKTVQSCVFDPLQALSLSSILECAVKCSQSDCKAFQFDRKSSICTLYAFDQICQSNTKCPYVTIYINNRYNELFQGDTNGPGYQIFKNVNYKNNDTLKAYVPQIIDKNHAKPLLKDENGNIIAALGSYRNSRLVIFPYENAFPIFDNMIKYLTNGICLDTEKCRGFTGDFKSSFGKNNIYFSPWSNSWLDIKAMKTYVSNNSWNFYVGGQISNFEVDKSIQELLQLFGMCFANIQTSWDGYLRGNVCENITSYKNETCASGV